MSGRNVDLDKFRLRSFVEKLIAIGEMEVHEQPVSLADLSAMIESSPKAKCFKRVGVEQYEMVAAVSGSRRRLAAAFGTDERNVIHEYMRRMNDPQPVVEVPSSDAPVHQVVVTGDAIDLSKLPFHLQHELDAAQVERVLVFIADDKADQIDVEIPAHRQVLHGEDRMAGARDIERRIVDGLGNGHDALRR